METLGETLSNAGRPAEAAAMLKEASRDAPPHTGLRLRHQSAKELMRGGFFEEGLREIEAVLSEVGLGLAKTPRRALLIVLRRMWLRLSGLRRRQRSLSDIAPSILSRLDSVWQS